MTQLNENVKELWEKRYAAYDGETYDEACERLVKNTFDKVDNETLLKYGKIFGYQTVEELRKDLLQALQEQYIIPNTPAWTNAGFENRALCACCTLGMPQDNLDSIMNTVTEAAKVTKAGYGLGINWSNIRPAQSNVNGKKKVASGPVSFMKLVDSALDTLVQNGGKDGTSNRSGAAMGILDCTHPDYETFITCKSEAGLKRTNISGMMYHDWLMKAFNDHESEERRLLNIQLRNMYDHAEASMAFYDNINKNWCDKENPIRQSNPCVIGETLLLTKDGYIPIEECVGKEVEAWNGLNWSKVIPRVTGHDQHCLRIGFSNGSYITCTDYHTFWLQNNKSQTKIEAKDLKIGDTLIKWDLPDYTKQTIFDKEAYTHGFFAGDGSDLTKVKPYIWVYNTKYCVIPYLDTTHISEPKYTNNNNNTRVCCALDWKYSGKKKYVPIDKPFNYKINWLAGLFDSDGTCTKDNNVQITSIDKNFFEQVCLLLCTIGIKSTLSKFHNEQKRLLPDGHGNKKEYNTHSCYRITLPLESVNKLYEYGMICYRLKIERRDFNRKYVTRYIRVTSIEDAGVYDTVYCANEPERHMLFFNRVLTGNCAEEFMPEYGTCNLVNINLPKTFVYHKDTKTFSETAGVIFLAYLWAELVNRTTYVPLEQMKKTIEDYQFIGISVMGLADMMIDDGIVYGSPESVKYCDELFGVLKDNVYAYSIKAADIFGTYNRYNSVKETENVIGTKFYYKNLKLRNALTMTCAPTGTTSMLANVSSGIEPLFSVAYEKECNGGTVLIVNELFRKKMHSAGYDDDEIDKICLTDVTEGGIKNAESIQKCTLIPESVRKLFVFNIDVDPYAQIDVMSAIQKHVDASISKTIILPNDYPFEKMLPLTEYAYEKGIKGFTVYRNHTRDAPIKLKSAEDKQLKIITPNQPMSDTDELGNERSMSSNICPSLTARLHTGCGKITITVATDPALDQNLLKVYISNTHSCVSNQTALGKTVYISARYMTPEQRLGYYKEITDAYHKIRCDSCKKSSRTECKSCADAIAKTIDAFLEMIQANAINIDYDKFKTIAEKHGHKLFRADNVRSVVQQPVPKVQHDVHVTNTDTLETFTCPDCGHESVKQGKCKQCVMCGWQSCVE